MCTMSKMNPIKAKDAPKAQGRQMTAVAFLKESACRERRYKRPPDCVVRAALSCPLHADQVRRPDGSATRPSGRGANLDSPD